VLEEQICRHHRSLRRENRSAPAEPIVTQSVAWRACVQECDVNRPLPRRSVTRRRVISSRKSPLRAEGETRSEKKTAFLRFDDHAPRHTCGLFSSRRRRSRPRCKIISCHFRRNRTQSTRTKHKVSRGGTCRIFKMHWSSDLFGTERKF